MNDHSYAADRAAIADICDSVRSALGPFAGNKFVLEPGGSVSITSSGAGVIDALPTSSPAVRLLQRATESFDERHGDGTTTMLALAGALLQNAEELRERGIHATTVERGFRRAADTASTQLKADALPLTADLRASLCKTALTGVKSPTLREEFGQSLAEVASRAGTEETLDPRNVKITTRVGGARSDTTLFDGLVLDATPPYDSMPRRLEGVRVALLSSTVDFRRIGSDAERTSDVEVTLSVDSYEGRAALRDSELAAFRESVRRMRDAGCQFVVTSRAVSDRVKGLLAEHDIAVLQRVDDDVMRLLVRLTGASVVPHLDQITDEALGVASVSVERKAGRDMTFVSTDVETPVCTAFCRAPDEHSLTAFERSVTAAINALADAEASETVVPGGGASEIRIARRIRSDARSVAGREQLVMDAFADAMRTVPRALAESSCLAGTTALTRLSAAHDDGRCSTGVDCDTGALVDVEEVGIVEPPRLKAAVVHAAVDTAVRFTRIDGTLPATNLSSSDSSETPTTE